MTDESTNPGVPLDLSAARARVSDIKFENLTRTKRDIVREIVAPLLAASNFQDIYVESAKVRNRFLELGLLKKCAIIHKQGNGQFEVPGVTNVAVEFHCEEGNRYGGGVFTNFGNNDASLNLQLKLPNLFGRGESLSGNFERSYSAYNSFSGTFSKPLVKDYERYNWRPRFDFTVFKANKDLPWSKFKEVDTGMHLDFNTQTETGHSNLIRTEMLWRHAHTSNAEVPLIVRSDLGHSVKTSVRHEYAYDGRNNSLTPTSGVYFRFQNELGKFQKDNPNSFYFLRQEAELQQNIPLYKLFSLQGSAKIGFLKSFGEESDLPISERFFLGGPLGMRGFGLNGTGPHEKGCALGANVYWLTGLHLYCPLPFKNNLNDLLRCHLFMNAGNISDKFDYEKLTKNIRVTAGAGLVMCFNQNYRVELNYCKPLQADGQDKKQEGLQFGIGIFYS